MNRLPYYTKRVKNLENQMDNHLSHINGMSHTELAESLNAESP